MSANDSTGGRVCRVRNPTQWSSPNHELDAELFRDGIIKLVTSNGCLVSGRVRIKNVLTQGELVELELEDLFHTSTELT